MYGMIRLAIGGIFLVCSIVAIQKSKAVRKRILYIISAGISIILTTVLVFLPFENLFVTFDSPTAAYEYYNFSKANDVLVVEGENCDFLIDRKNDNDNYLMIPKTANGWKIGIGSDIKWITHSISDGVSVSIYRYKHTKDCFISVFDTNGGVSTVSDEYDTKFIPSERNNDTLGKAFITYYAHIPEPDAGYSITVNGNKIKL